MVAKYQIRVAWDECDPDGLVHIVNYYRWMDQALHALMLEAGFGHRAIYEKFGAYVPAVEASARCMSPLRFDDAVTIEAEISRWGRRSFRLDYRGYCGARLVFEGMEARVWATIEDGEARSAAIPEAFRLALSELASVPIPKFASIRRDL
jgi:YbgC/YbaW family acyl-CoA thioester hydrolase